MNLELLGKTQVLRLCSELEIRPSKKHGQNFVTDPGTVRRIARAACLEPGQLAVEIGPGLGSLTLALLETGARVAAIEIDSRLSQALCATVASRGACLKQLRVFNRDALEITEATQLSHPDWPNPEVLVSNLPYNVATALLLHSLESLPSVKRAVVMVQAEVASRWTAGVGEDAYGAPSVKLAWWGRARKAFPVGREVFYPAPNVDSAVVTFHRESILERLVKNGVPLSNPTPTDLEALRRRTFELINVAFSQRRKTLRQSMSGFWGSTEAAEAAVLAAGVDSRLRAENLDVCDFARIAWGKSSEIAGKVL